eukprot:354425-Rhodomonas_salina.1
MPNSNAVGHQSRTRCTTRHAVGSKNVRNQREYATCSVHFVPRLPLNVFDLATSHLELALQAVEVLSVLLLYLLSPPPP